MSPSTTLTFLLKCTQGCLESVVTTLFKKDMCKMLNNLTLGVHLLTVMLEFVLLLQAVLATISSWNQRWSQALFLKLLLQVAKTIFSVNHAWPRCCFDAQSRRNFFSCTLDSTIFQGLYRLSLCINKPVNLIVIISTLESVILK